MDRHHYASHSSVLGTKGYRKCVWRLAAKMPVNIPASHTRVVGLITQLCPPFHLPAQVDHTWLPSLCKCWGLCHPHERPGLSLQLPALTSVQSWLLHREVKQWLFTLCWLLSLSSPLSFSHLSIILSVLGKATGKEEQKIPAGQPL